MNRLNKEIEDKVLGLIETRVVFELEKKAKIDGRSVRLIETRVVFEFNYCLSR